MMDKDIQMTSRIDIVKLCQVTVSNGQDSFILRIAKIITKVFFKIFPSKLVHFVDLSSIINMLQELKLRK